jgi:hypothetical protein
MHMTSYCTQGIRRTSEHSLAVYKNLLTVEKDDYNHQRLIERAYHRHAYAALCILAPFSLSSCFYFYQPIPQ